MTEDLVHDVGFCNLHTAYIQYTYSRRSADCRNVHRYTLRYVVQYINVAAIVAIQWGPE